MKVDVQIFAHMCHLQYTGKLGVVSEWRCKGSTLTFTSSEHLIISRIHLRKSILITLYGMLDVLHTLFMHSAISILTSLKDIWTGIHLDKTGQSQTPNWTYSKMQRWHTVLNNSNVCSLNGMHAWRNLMIPAWFQGSLRLNTVLTNDLLTFECHAAGLYCFC